MTDDQAMLRALEDGNEWRVRVLPVLGPLPAIFGLSIASWIICDIAGGKGVGGVELMQPMESRVRKKAFDKVSGPGYRESRAKSPNIKMISYATSPSCPAILDPTRAREPRASLPILVRLQLRPLEQAPTPLLCRR